MTEADKSMIRKMYHDMADKQADDIISAFERVESAMPEGTGQENASAMLKQIAEQASAAVSHTTAEVANKMREQAHTQFGQLMKDQFAKGASNGNNKVQ